MPTISLSVKVIQSISTSPAIQTNHSTTKPRSSKYLEGMESLPCTLCKTNILYKHKFVKHLEDDHGVFFEQDFILAINQIGEYDKETKRITVENTNIKKFKESNASSLKCIFCHGTVKYTNLENHMIKQHEVIFDLEFLIATCFIPKEERDNLRYVIANQESFKKLRTSSKRKLPYTAILDDERINKVAKTNFGKELEIDNDFNLVSCEKCDEHFEDREHMNIHLKLVHGDKGFLQRKGDSEQIKGNQRQGGRSVEEQDIRGPQEKQGRRLGKHPDLRIWLLEQRKKRESTV